MTKDPVCGMEIRTGPVAWLLGLSNTDIEKPIRLEHQGHKYVFCSPACMKEFEAEPDRYSKS